MGNICTFDLLLGLFGLDPVLHLDRIADGGVDGADAAPNQLQDAGRVGDEHRSDDEPRRVANDHAGGAVGAGAGAVAACTAAAMEAAEAAATCSALVAL